MRVPGTEPRTNSDRALGQAPPDPHAAAGARFPALGPDRPIVPPTFPTTASGGPAPTSGIPTSPAPAGPSRERQPVGQEYAGAGVGVPPAAAPTGRDPAGAGGYPDGPVSAPPDAAGATGPAPRRRRLPVVLAVVLLLVLAGVGVAVVRPGPVAGWLGGEADETQADTAAPEPAPSVVLAGADPNAPEPTPDGVRAALDPLVRAAALGDRVNVSVADVLTGQPLFGQGADDGTVPASVTKLVTAVTVLAARGPGYRIPTRAVAGANPGEVVIVGGGDITLAVDRNGFYPGAARLDDLADQVKRALGGTKPTKVIIDGSLYSGPTLEPAWDEDIPTGGYGSKITALMTDGARRDVAQAKRDHDAGNHAAPRSSEPDLAAGRSFARLLGLPNSAVTRGTAPPAGADATAGAPGGELGKVESPPLVRLVDIMITDSDNILAEALARQVALARNQPASFVGAAAAVDQVAGELGLAADELALADGSGLSRTNRISPSLLTDLITLAGNGDHPELAAIFGGLPVGGWSGTLGDRYGTAATESGAGVVRAKTGTLTGVSAIAGVVTTKEGRLLTFAVLTDRVPADGTDSARAALDRITATLASCGCR
ncbi:D-alanyl-D-alanine carboxypeptidase / D-alanyl-D-alanine-endopeptidase (penicillin-binding protein 4) [Micromonospora avicenniae]|uniref:D-alanyl-D-alanine carboxypeptidase / D-alanyl-D-alanine-endopeptidase (Penicillin-binding protein 4) n=1 Tax=Micromonospora avicenniae TaxID=1198245 RepID=A0A1N6R4T7_9ACTN|nr:D-alanyl-D-alanine carboxypeptidase / D-alanyl-D-alanine-endopeptidase (penicillin-binding protein 4) [Micromonospora avicenniae]